MFQETLVKNKVVSQPCHQRTPRPCPPSSGKTLINKLDSSDTFKVNNPFQPFPGSDSPKERESDMFYDLFTSTTANEEADPNNFANFNAYHPEDVIEWANGQ